MKESIKKRIEAVRRGEVPEGYVSKSHQLRPVDWKYEKIGKYLVPYNEFSNDTRVYPLATSSRQGLMLQSEYYIDQRYEETTGGFHVVPVGYVTYRHMSDDDIFRFNLNKIGQPVLVSPEYPVFTTTGGLNQDLLVAYLNGMKEFQAFCSAQKKGSTRTRMYFRRLCEFTIPIPSITEQQKIAEILAICDRMIELKQSKIDELNKLKQVCLLEMFPQKGQTIPKRRFPGFSAPWEQRKLGELADIVGGGTPSTDVSDFWDGDIDWYAPAEIAEQIYLTSSQRKITEEGYFYKQCQNDKWKINNLNIDDADGLIDYMNKNINYPKADKETSVLEIELYGVQNDNVKNCTLKFSASKYVLYRIFTEMSPN